MEKTRLGLSQNVLAAAAYSLPFLAVLSGLLILLVERENRFVRFHAMQSLILFGFYGAVTCLLNIIPFFGGLLASLLGFVALMSWLLLVYNALKGNYYKFPFIGEAIYEKMVG